MVAGLAMEFQPIMPQNHKFRQNQEILEVLALLAEGSRISSLTRVKGYKEDTILSWMREASQHSAKIDEILLKDFRVKRGQLDGLWAYVRNKGEKKIFRNA